MPLTTIVAVEERGMNRGKTVCRVAIVLEAVLGAVFAALPRRVSWLFWARCNRRSSRPAAPRRLEPRNGGVEAVLSDFAVDIVVIVTHVRNAFDDDVVDFPAVERLAQAIV